MPEELLGQQARILKGIKLIYIGSVQLHQSNYAKSSLTRQVLLADGVQRRRPSEPQCNVENIIL